MVVNFDAELFNQSSFEVIQQLSAILESNELEIGEFEVDIFKIDVKRVKTYEKDLVN